MHAEQLQAQIQALAQRIQALLAHCQAQQKGLQQLQQENTRLRQQAANNQARAQNFSNRPEIGTITKVDKPAGHFTKQIDSYIQELDRLIAHLQGS